VINNSGKVAAVFGVRNDLSISYKVASSLKESGANVALSYTKDTKVDVLALADDLSIPSELCMEVDVRSEEQIAAFLSMLNLKFSGIDYILHGVAYGNHHVMCSAGIGSVDKTSSEYIDIPFEDLMDSFNISAYSLLRISRVAKPFLNKSASILSLTYNASTRVNAKYGGMSVNKAALENITMYLADYFGPMGVRVNTISAGFVMSTSAAGIQGARSLRKLGKEISPLGNIKAQDVANAALYYFSDLSSKVTGNLHFVDGGMNIMAVSSMRD
jgi:enoyl-[acyl-carrier protein] reductase I